MSRVAPLWWTDLCSSYLRWLARKNSRPTTLATYKTELFDFGSWLLEQRVTSLLELRKDHIDAWQDDLRTRKAASTQRVAASALRGLLKYAAAEEVPLSSPSLYLRVAMPRVPANLPRPVPTADLRVIEHALGEKEPWHPWRLRTRALFWVLYSSGCRLGEALSLRRTSFDGDSAVVVQKGGRQHTILISTTAQVAVADYLACRTDPLPNLFLSQLSDRALAKKEVQDSWDLLAQALEIRRFTSHQLRHACATAILRETGDVALAAKHLGHRGLQAIQGYAEVAIDKRRGVVAALSSRSSQQADL